METKDLEALQITLRKPIASEAAPELRRSDKPLKSHENLANKFADAQKMIEELQRQGAGIQAVISQKASVSAQMAKELASAAAEYKDHTFRTKRILLKLEDIPERKVKTPKYSQAIEFMLQKLESISADMRKEAEAFIESTKGTVPGHTELAYQELAKESYSPMTEAWLNWRRLLDRIRGWLGMNDEKLSDLEAEVDELVAEAM